MPSADIRYVFDKVCTFLRFLFNTDITCTVRQLYIYTGSGEVSFLYFLFQVKFHNISSYPTYHSIHDTFAYVKKFVDPQFTTHLAIAQVWASAAFLLAHTPILPINCSDYATALRRGALDIKKTYEDDLTQKGISLGERNSCLCACSISD